MTLSVFQTQQQLKICNQCNATTSKKWFRDYDGQEYICSTCYNRNWCKDNPDYHLNWERKHRESVNESSRRWKLKNPQYVKEYNKNRPPFIKSPEKVKQDSLRRIVYKDKRIYLESNPRTGQCAVCHKKAGIDGIKRTLRHHVKYHDNDVLKDTIELCNACHTREHPSRPLRIILIHSNRKVTKLKYMSGTFHIPEQEWMKRVS